MADGKILNHPDREEIIQKLLSGVSPNKVHDWLNEKYTSEEEKQHHITVKAISDFRKNHLNLDREAARLLKKERQKKELGLPYNANASAFIEKIDEDEEGRALRVKDTLLNSPTYREKLKDITDAHLDAPRLIKEMQMLLQSRIETYYNAIASAPSVGDTLKADKMFVDYVRLATDVLKDSKKVWDDYNTTPDEGTVDLNVVHEMVGFVRQTVEDMFAEIGPDLALEFMDRLNKRMTNLKYEIPKPPDILERVEKLNEQIRHMRGDSDE